MANRPIGKALRNFMIDWELFPKKGTKFVLSGTIEKPVMTRFFKVGRRLGKMTIVIKPDGRFSENIVVVDPVAVPTERQLRIARSYNGAGQSRHIDLWPLVEKLGPEERILTGCQILEDAAVNIQRHPGLLRMIADPLPDRPKCVKAMFA